MPYLSVPDYALFVGAAFASQMHMVECQSSCLVKVENLKLVEPQIIGWGLYFSEMELFMTELVASALTYTSYTEVGGE